MAVTKIYNQKGEAVGEMDLSENVFGVKANEALVHQAVLAQMANERQVLAHTKIRSEVRGGGRKPWAQKGTGRARQGSIRAPQWIGGGIVFGPRSDRNFKTKINKKMRQKAMFMVLSDKLGHDNLLVVDKLEMSEYRTKVFNGILKNLEKNFNNKDGKKKKRSLLVMSEAGDGKVRNSGRNLAGVEMAYANNINIVDLIKYQKLILTADTVRKIEAQYKK